MGILCFKSYLTHSYFLADLLAARLQSHATETESETETGSYRGLDWRSLQSDNYGGKLSCRALVINLTRNRHLGKREAHYSEGTERQWRKIARLPGTSLPWLHRASSHSRLLVLVPWVSILADCIRLGIITKYIHHGSTYIPLRVFGLSALYDGWLGLGGAFEI